MILPAVKVALERWFSFLTPLTYFEICGFCKAQNRGARPWLAPVSQQAKITVNRKRQTKKTYPITGHA
ncbi:hypothetical protein JP39_00835 [Companilactobacillus heilongjiangensis]|uniref:Uncharacterized protein n=1 Tax=Companilactobacillus heilongjiangensis TaxID=1074467 RepID=A0A0K2L9S1_9LACO|nr:hypothetical protein JP39_00835 [Companilactobacillus heilongjiangensis]